MPVTAGQHECLVEMRKLASDDLHEHTHARALAEEHMRAHAHALRDAVRACVEFDDLQRAEGPQAAPVTSCGREELSDRVGRLQRRLHRARTAVLQASTDTHRAECAVHRLDIAIGDTSPGAQAAAKQRRRRHTAYVRAMRDALGASRRTLVRAHPDARAGHV